MAAGVSYIVTEVMPVDVSSTTRNRATRKQAFFYMIADVVRQRGHSDEDGGMTQKERLFKQFVSLLWASGGSTSATAHSP